MTKNALLTDILATIIFGAAAVGAIRSCQKNSDASKPGAVYFIINGRVLERRFDTQEQFQQYIDSEKGRQEAEYYMPSLEQQIK